MKNLSFTVCGIAALVFSAAGFAGGFDDANAIAAPSSISGFYFSGNAGYGFNNSSKLAGFTIKRNGFVWNAESGYRFNDYFAVGAGYTWYPTTQYSIDGHTLVKQSLGSMYLALKGIYPINQQFDVFAKVGLSDMFLKDSGYQGNNHWQSVSDTRVAPLFGIGADYNVTENFAVTAQAFTTLKSGPVPATYAGTLGLTYTI